MLLYQCCFNSNITTVLIENVVLIEEIQYAYLHGYLLLTTSLYSGTGHGLIGLWELSSSIYWQSSNH